VTNKRAIPLIQKESASQKLEVGLVGFSKDGRARRVIGIDASATPKQTKAQVLEIARNTAKLVDLSQEITETDVVLLEDYAFPCYGVPSEETKNAIRLCARLEGMITDPVYEGAGSYNYCGAAADEIGCKRRQPIDLIFRSAAWQSRGRRQVLAGKRVKVSVGRSSLPFGSLAKRFRAGSTSAVERTGTTDCARSAPTRRSPRSLISGWPRSCRQVRFYPGEC
jgi:hypothetical protein